MSQHKPEPATSSTQAEHSSYDLFPTDNRCVVRCVVSSEPSANTEGAQWHSGTTHLFSVFENAYVSA